MRCMHCGSSCTNAMPEELTTEEALSLCDDLGKMGMKWITLSGGEPLTRKDWPLLAKGLKKNGIIPNMITNGWLLDKETVLKMRECELGTVAISLDGTEKTHDSIRREGSFERNIKAFKLLKQHGQYTGAITSVNKNNLGELPAIRDILIEAGVDSWQVQICIPMGNMAEHRENLIDAEDIETILDFCLDVAKRGDITIYPADCLGYYSEKEELIRQYSLGSGGAGAWAGCNAGIRGFGILHNGDILGCTSIRDRSFIEGNIRERSILEIWNGADSFEWSRKMTKNDLTGECKTCAHGDICLGGCPNTRLTMNGTIHSENPYCTYRTAMLKLKEKLVSYSDSETLFKTAQRFAREEAYQEAAMILEKLKESNPQDLDILSLLGFTHFFMGNYDEAQMANQEILDIDPENSYANKGLGLSLHRKGYTEEGICYIRKAIETAPDNFPDPYYDLAAVYREIGDHTSAENVLARIPV